MERIMLNIEFMKGLNYSFRVSRLNAINFECNSINHWTNVVF